MSRPAGGRHIAGREAVRPWAPRLAAALLVLATTAGLGEAAATVREEDVQAIASQLRCVVCQNLSVADSPSEMAHQMRDLIRERLTAGDQPDQVMAYFVQRYGEWVLLAPRPAGLISSWGSRRSEPWRVASPWSWPSRAAGAGRSRRSPRPRRPWARRIGSGSPRSSSACATSGPRR